MFQVAKVFSFSWNLWFRPQVERNIEQKCPNMACMQHTGKKQYQGNNMIFKIELYNFGMV